MSVNNFDVLKELSKRNKKIKAFLFNDNLKRVNTGSHGWGDVTVAIDTQTAGELMAGTGAVGVVLGYDVNEFRELKAAMEAGELAARGEIDDLRQRLEDATGEIAHLKDTRQKPYDQIEVLRARAEKA